MEAGRGTGRGEAEEMDLRKGLGRSSSEMAKLHFQVT